VLACILTRGVEGEQNSCAQMLWGMSVNEVGQHSAARHLWTRGSRAEASTYEPNE